MIFLTSRWYQYKSSANPVTDTDLTDHRSSGSSNYKENQIARGVTASTKGRHNSGWMNVWYNWVAC